MSAEGYRPAVVVPVYNHPQKLRGLVTEILAHNVPCWLVDDGSEPGCAAVIEQLATQPQVHLVRLSTNQGKGAAVCAGLLAASEAGCSHVLQIDADHQHAPADIPTLLAVSQSQPNAIVSGSRGYRSMPGARSAGRRLTDFWVCVNTLSTGIEDSMCGFRVYPVRRVLDIVGEMGVRHRMDFDTDIIVKCYWHGMDVANVGIQVAYDDGVPSHFRMWSDNCRITVMHTFHFFGMLKRIPKLLARRGSTKQSSQACAR